MRTSKEQLPLCSRWTGCGGQGADRCPGPTHPRATQAASVKVQQWGVAVEDSSTLPRPFQTGPPSLCSEGHGQMDPCLLCKHPHFLNMTWTFLHPAIFYLYFECVLKSSGSCIYLGFTNLRKKIG